MDRTATATTGFRARGALRPRKPTPLSEHVKPVLPDPAEVVLENVSLVEGRIVVRTACDGPITADRAKFTPARQKKGTSRTLRSSSNGKYPSQDACTRSPRCASRGRFAAIQSSIRRVWAKSRCKSGRVAAHPEGKMRKSRQAGMAEARMISAVSSSRSRLPGWMQVTTSRIGIAAAPIRHIASVVFEYAPGEFRSESCAASGPSRLMVIDPMP